MLELATVTSKIVNILFFLFYLDLFIFFFNFGRSFIVWNSNDNVEDSNGDHDNSNNRTGNKK